MVLLSVSGDKGVERIALQVALKLIAYERAVDTGVTREHAQAMSKALVLHFTPGGKVLAAVKGDAIGQAPPVALSHGCAHLIHHGQPLLVRCAEIAEDLTRELAPVVIQKILHRARHRAMIIRRSQHESISPVDRMVSLADAIRFGLALRAID